jgi:hypothetical protein
MAEIIDADFIKQRLSGVSPEHCIRKSDLTKESASDAESTSYISPASVFVKETGRTYIFDPASTAARDGRSVLTPAGGGRLLATKTGSDDVEIPKIGTPDHQSLTQSLQVGLSTGACNGNLVTDAGSGAINIASGEGMIRVANSSDSEIFAFRWPAVNGVTIPLNSARYVGVEYNSGSPQAVVRTTNNWNGQTEFQAATVVNEGGTLHILNNPQETCDGVQKIFHRLIETQPFQFAERLGGGRFSEVGTRNLSMSPCEFYDGLNEFPITIKNTSTGDTFDAYYGSFTKIAAQTQWDNQNYDNAGTLTALSANRYGVHWLYIEMDDSFALVYGQGNYTTISDAEAALPPASLPLRLSLGSRLAAKLIFQKGAASAIQIESAFDTQFQSGMPASHSDLTNILGNGPYHLSEAERDVVALYRGSGTTSSRNALTGLAVGQTWYNTDRSTVETYNGTVWLSPGVCQMTNRAAVALTEGMTVKLNESFSSAVTRSTEFNEPIFGIVVDGGSDGAEVTVTVSGVWNVLVLGSAVVGVGDWLATHSTDGISYVAYTGPYPANTAHSQALVASSAGGNRLVKAMVGISQHHEA